MLRLDRDTTPRKPAEHEVGRIQNSDFESRVSENWLVQLDFLITVGLDVKRLGLSTEGGWRAGGSIDERMVFKF